MPNSIKINITCHIVKRRLLVQCMRGVKIHTCSKLSKMSKSKFHSIWKFQESKKNYIDNIKQILIHAYDQNSIYLYSYKNNSPVRESILKPETADML